MKYLVALAALLLAGCTATIDRPQPAPTPFVVVYVRDEAAIAEARTDGATQAILASAVVAVTIIVLGSISYAVAHTRREQPAQQQLPPVTYVTHNHLHLHGATSAQVAVRKMLDEVQS